MEDKTIFADGTGRDSVTVGPSTLARFVPGGGVSLQVATWGRSAKTVHLTSDAARDVRDALNEALGDNKPVDASEARIIELGDLVVGDVVRVTCVSGGRTTSLEGKYIYHTDSHLYVSDSAGQWGQSIQLPSEGDTIELLKRHDEVQFLLNGSAGEVFQLVDDSYGGFTVVGGPESGLGNNGRWPCVWDDGRVEIMSTARLACLFGTLWTKAYELTIEN